MLFRLTVLSYSTLIVCQNWYLSKSLAVLSENLYYFSSLIHSDAKGQWNFVILKLVRKNSMSLLLQYVLFVLFQVQITTLCVSISLSASVALVCLFTPKMYIIFLQPEKNVRKLTMMMNSMHRKTGEWVLLVTFSFVRRFLTFNASGILSDVSYMLMSLFCPCQWHKVSVQVLSMTQNKYTSSTKVNQSNLD